MNIYAAENLYTYHVQKLDVYFGSFTNLLLAFEIAVDLSFTVSFPIALIIAAYVGFYMHVHIQENRKKNLVKYNGNKIN